MIKLLNFLKKVLLIALFAFLFNLAWEVTHSPLYKTITDMGAIEYIPRILIASLGDVIIILAIFFLITLCNLSFRWKLCRKNILLSVLFGIIIAVGFELYAQYTSRFVYNASMPIIPILRVGLTPVLQMIFTPLLAFFFSDKFN